MLHRLVRRNPHHLYRQSLSDNRNRAGTLFRLEGRSLGLRNDGQHQATPFGKTLEEAQALIEQIGREKGADAIVFEGVVSETSAPTYTTTEKIEKNDDGSKTRTATTSQSVFTTNRLLATFIKYKTQTN